MDCLDFQSQSVRDSDTVPAFSSALGHLKGSKDRSKSENSQRHFFTPRSWSAGRLPNEPTYGLFLTCGAPGMEGPGVIG